MRLFDRIVKVTIGRQPVEFIAENPRFFERTLNAIEVSDLRIQFDVTKGLGKEPNRCEIKITNLSPDTRADLERSMLRVTLHAGYDGVARLLFVGDCPRAYSQREGADIVTTLRVSDGLRAYSHARMNRSYRPPISVRKVLGDAAASMNLRLPPEVEQSNELKQALASGISMHGPTRDILTRLLAPYGYSWSIQNGQLQILRDEQARAGQAYVVNSDSGMIGAPEQTTPDRPRSRPEVKFETLLFPELLPGGLVKVQSDFLNVTAKMTDVKHSGDNRIGDFKTSVTARPQ